MMRMFDLWILVPRRQTTGDLFISIKTTIYRVSTAPEYQTTSAVYNVTVTATINIKFFFVRFLKKTEKSPSNVGDKV